MIRLAEGFLGDLPVGVDDLGDVGLLVAMLEVPDLELILEFAEEVVEGLGVVGIGVDDDEARPLGDLGLGQ